MHLRKANLDLREGESENLGGHSKPDDGPAIAVGHMQLVQASLYLLQGVVEGVCDGRQPAIILRRHLKQNQH